MALNILVTAAAAEAIFPAKLSSVVARAILLESIDTKVNDDVRRLRRQASPTVHRRLTGHMMFSRYTRCVQVVSLSWLTDHPFPHSPHSGLSRLSMLFSAISVCISVCLSFAATIDSDTVLNSRSSSVSLSSAATTSSGKTGYGWLSLGPHLFRHLFASTSSPPHSTATTILLLCCQALLHPLQLALLVLLARTSTLYIVENAS